MSSHLAQLFQAHTHTLTEHSRAALEAEGFDALVVHSGTLVSKSRFDDQYWPMRPVPTFEHWADILWPDCAILVSAKAPTRLLAVRDNSFWERPIEPDWSVLEAGLDVAKLDSIDALKNEVAEGQRTAVITHNEADAARLGLDPSYVNPTGLLQRLHGARAIKSAYEIECSAEASRVAARGHLAAKAAFESGVRSELQIHLRYLEATQQDDSQTPYKNIVALGDAAAVLHHVYYREVPGAPSMLIDAGATFRRYNSDITRTYVEAKASEAHALFGALIQGVEKLQQEVIAGVRVGVAYESLHDRAHSLLAGLLTDTGLLNCSDEAAVASGLTRKFFPHGLGHSLGVQVHDVGCRERAPRDDNPWLRNTSVIAAGQLFTIEPGLYFIESLLEELRVGAQKDDVNWSKIDALKEFGGIRIEDNVLVRAPSEASAVRNLTREAFEAVG